MPRASLVGDEIRHGGQTVAVVVPKARQETPLCDQICRGDGANGAGDPREIKAIIADIRSASRTGTGPSCVGKALQFGSGR